MRTNLKNWLAMFMFFLGMAGTVAGQIIFVDADAIDTNNGSSWGNAFNYLQDAVAAASSGDEIWVAEGVYKPDQGKGIRPGDRNATFKLKNGVAIYGGFPSGGGKWEESNPQQYETILSGDLGGDDVGNLDDLSKAENSHRIVIGTKAGPTAILDGFTITAGRWVGGAGAGMLNNPGSPTIRNCTFRGNLAKFGGAVSNSEISKPTFIDCTFIGNSGKYGGAMHNRYSTPMLTNCKFIRNLAESGGGIDNQKSDPTLTNCIFSGNSAVRGGGLNNYESKPTLINCTFNGNLAKDCGGGVYNKGAGSPILINCILWNNRDSNSIGESAQIYNDSIFKTLVNYSCIQGLTGDLGGTGNIDGDPLFVSPGYWADANDSSTLMDPFNDDAVWVEGDYRLLPDSPCIDAGDNAAVPSSVVVDLDGKARIIDGNGDGSATVDMGAYEYGG